MNKEELYLAEDNLAAEIEEISEFVFNHAELGSEEFKSCKYLVEKLKEHGFTVTCPYLDLDTAFFLSTRWFPRFHHSFLPLPYPVLRTRSYSPTSA